MTQHQQVLTEDQAPAVPAPSTASKRRMVTMSPHRGVAPLTVAADRVEGFEHGCITVYFEGGHAVGHGDLVDFLRGVSRGRIIDLRLPGA